MRRVNNICDIYEVRESWDISVRYLSYTSPSNPVVMFSGLMRNDVITHVRQTPTDFLKSLPKSHNASQYRITIHPFEHHRLMESFLPAASYKIKLPLMRSVDIE